MQRESYTAVVFGVFDLLHPGHVSFLKQARKKGNELIVVVARDAAVKKLKKKEPHYSERERVAHIRKEFPRGVRVVLGDKRMGAYGAIKRYQPDVICVGYDQRALKADLQQRMQDGLLPRMRIVRLRPHKPRTFHTALLRRKRLQK